MPEPFGGFADEQPEQKKQKSFTDKLSETNLARIAKQIFGAATLPGDVYAGKVDPMSDEAIGRSADLAGMVTGGGAGRSLGRAVERIPEAPAVAREEMATPRGAIPGMLSSEGEEHVAQFGAQAERQTGSAAERIARGFDPQGQMVARSGEEGGALMQHGLRRAEEIERKQIEGNFQLSTGDFGGTAKPASIHTDVVMGMPQQMTKDLQANRIQISSTFTPFANKMLTDINRHVNALVKRNQGVPSGGKVTNINLAAIDATKQRMNAYRRAAIESGKKTDIAASQKIMESFDKQVDGWVNGQKFSGDPRAVQAWNVARQRENIYRSTFESGGRDTVGNTVERIIGENKHAPQTGRAAADYAIGSIGTNPPGYNAKVMTGIKNILGADSPEWAGARQGTWMNLVRDAKGAWQPREVKTRILDFLDGKGREVSLAMYSPQERATMRAFAETQGKLDVIRTAPGGAQVAQAIMRWAMRSALEPLGTYSKYVHMGIDSTTARAAQTRELRDLQEKLPLVGQQMQKWFEEVQRIQRSNAGLPRVAREKQFAATRKLSEALRNKYGIGGIAPGMTMQAGKQDKLSTERAFGGPQF